MNMTSFLAAWGAILSTATAAWTIYKDRLDRAKIKLTVRLRCIGLRDGDRAPFMADPAMNIANMSDQLYVVVSVTNVGRRRFAWQGWGGRYHNPVNGKDGFLVSARFLPKILEEQESLDEFAELNRQFVDGNVKQLYIWNAAGRKWSATKKDMKNLAEQIKKHADVFKVEKPAT